VLNIVGVLGTNTAYVGLTGADGGISSTQIISNFHFASLTPLSTQITETNTVILTWPNSAAGLVLQQTSALGSTWTTTTDCTVMDSNGNNQVIVTLQADASFYRLATP
jgi:hypothetical protein